MIARAEAGEKICRRLTVDGRRNARITTRRTWNEPAPTLNSPMKSGRLTWLVEYLPYFGTRASKCFPRHNVVCRLYAFGCGPARLRSSFMAGTVNSLSLSKSSA